MAFVRHNNNKKGFKILINLYIFVFVFLFVTEKICPMLQKCSSFARVSKTILMKTNTTKLRIAIYSFCDNGDINLELHCWDNAFLPCNLFLQQMSSQCVIGAVSHDCAQYLSENQFVLSGNQGWHRNCNTTWKVSQYGVFPHLYFPVFGLNTGKYGPEKIRI